MDWVSSRCQGDGNDDERSKYCSEGKVKKGFVVKSSLSMMASCSIYPCAARRLCLTHRFLAMVEPPRTMQHAVVITL